MKPDLCRVIGIIDVDSFECQIWQNKLPQFKNRPCVVTNAGGRSVTAGCPVLQNPDLLHTTFTGSEYKILSVTHEAKELGITRDLKIGEAKRICPRLKVFKKPDKFKKPNSSYYSEPRAASNEIQYCIFKFCKNKKITIEKVPMDEWYLDLTNCVEYRIAKAKYNEEDPIPGFYEEEEGSHVTLESTKRLNVNKLLRKMEYLERKFPEYNAEEHRLTIGACIMDDLIENIYEQTDFVCSGGVSFNKLLAKQAVKLQKPNALTILSSFGLERVSKIIELRDIHGLGSIFGEQVSEMLPRVKTMFDLRKLKVSQLTHRYGFDMDDADYLYNLARGICNEDVIPKLFTDSVNCGKNNLRIRDNGYLRHCLDLLCDEMMGRLEEEWTQFGRIPNSMKIIFSYIYEDEGYHNEATIERTINYSDGDDAEYIAQECFMEIRNWGFNPYDNDGTIITKLTVSANRFENVYN